MTEVLFYHLQDMTLENVLPPLLEKSLRARLARGRAGRHRRSASRRSTRHLWTYRDDSFLPHATWRAARSPRAADRADLTARAIRTGPDVRFLVDNAPLPADAAPMSGWCWFSTATTPMRLKRRAQRLDR